MAVYIHGFDEERFASKVDRNFLCLICFSVLRDPVLCSKNGHHFCRACITKHLENFSRCPTCADILTVQILTEPPRMVKDYLNELDIHCAHKNRGCQEIVQLQHLERHETSCGFMPVVCSNQECDATVNKRDLIHHQSEVCEFRKVKCHSCDEMSRTLAEMERRMGRMERNLAVVEGNVATKVSDMGKNVATDLKNMERNVATSMTSIKANVSDIEKHVATNIEAMGRNVSTKVSEMEKTVAINMSNMERNVAAKVSDMEKDLTTNMKNMETNLAANMARNVATKVSDIEKNVGMNVSDMGKNVVTNMKNMEEKLAATMKGNVKNEVTGLNTALVKAFEEMKDVLVKVEEENPRKRQRTAGGDRENIIVAGGVGTDTVEMFDWRKRTWSPLQSMSKQRWRATSFLYNDSVVIAGGLSSDSTGFAHDMIYMNVDRKPDRSFLWSECPVGLPDKLTYHNGVLDNNQLIVAGGNTGSEISDKIIELQLGFPYTPKVLARMPEPRQNHCMEAFDDSLLIVGGSSTYRFRESCNSVLLYEKKKNVFKQMAPLPYEVSKMACVRWEDNIVVIGGADKHGKALDTVILYNAKTERSRMLPVMRCKRLGCTAVIIENNIVVLGGLDEQERVLKTVEAFNFDRYTWVELPEMSVARWLHTAVVV